MSDTLDDRHDTAVGIVNPVILELAQGYSSDPDLVWNPGLQRFELIDRMAVFPRVPLRASTSTDGTTWTD